MEAVNFLHVGIYQSVQRSLLGGSNLISTGVSVSIDTFFLCSDLRNQWSKVLEMSRLLNSYLHHGLVFGIGYTCRNDKIGNNACLHLLLTGNEGV